MLCRIRMVIALATAAAVLASCGGSDSAGGEPAVQVYSVTHGAGVAHQVPVDPKRIVALDEYAALNLLDLGVRPHSVYGALSSDAAAAVLRSEGIEVTPAPTMIMTPDFESIAAQRPDLIVLTTPGPSISDTYARFSRIAPTIVLPYEKPWREMLTITGSAFRREAEANKVAAALERRTAQVRDQSAGGEASVAVLGSFSGTFYSPAMINPMSITLGEIGFTRPEAEVKGVPTGASTTAVPFSRENLPDHNAARVVVLDGGIYNAAAVRSLPTFATLDGARTGQVFLADGGLWSANFALGTWWVLEDSARIKSASTGATLGTTADAVDRWRDLRSAVSG